MNLHLFHRDDIFALIRFDAALLIAEWRAIMIRKRDALTLIFALPALILIARSWLSDLPEARADQAAFAIAALTSLLLLTGAIARVRMHRSEGPIARLALRRGAAFACVLATLAVGQAVAVGLAAALGVADPFDWLLGGAAGIALAALIVPMLNAGASRTPLLRQASTWLSPKGPPAVWVMPAVGLALGLAIALALQFAWVDSATAMGLAATITVPLCIALSWVDYDTVRFRLLIGHRPLAIIASSLREALMTGGALAIGLALALDWRLPSLAAVLSAACGALAALSILVASVYSRRMAEWALTVLLAAIAMAGIAAPPLAPVLLLVAALWLAHRARQQRWIIS